MRKDRLYFGRPINIYDSRLDTILLQKVREAFSSWEIEDSGLPKHNEGYERWKKDCGNGMEYYFQEVLPNCQGGVFLRFRDGKWGAGVYSEAKYFFDRGFPVWIITPRGKIKWCNLLTVEVLSVEETRERIRDAKGNRKPY